MFTKKSNKIVFDITQILMMDFNVFMDNNFKSVENTLSNKLKSILVRNN